MNDAGPQAERAPKQDVSKRLQAWALLHNFTLHVVTGFLAVGVHYGILYALLRFGVHPLAGSAAGFAGGALVRFVFSYWRVFTPSHGLTIAGRRFVVAIALQAVANNALLALFLALGVSVWPSQVATTVLLTFANYAVYRLWVFR